MGPSRADQTLEMCFYNDLISAGPLTSELVKHGMSTDMGISLRDEPRVRGHYQIL